MTSSIGEILKKARSEKKLTLEQVSDLTHIRVNYLKALENDERGRLPSDVQGKGFLRLYGGFLGLDERTLLDLWEGKGFLPASPDKPAEQIYTADAVIDAAASSVKEAPAVECIAERTIKTDPEREAGAEAPTLHTSSTEIFRDIGQMLRSQRESLGLKLPDIERYILVRQHYLEALENGNLEELPSPVQGRGMLNNYSRFLELDSDGILLRFAEGLQVRQLERTRQLTKENTVPLHKKRQVKRGVSLLKQFLTPDLIFGSLVTISLIIFAVWSAANLMPNREDEPEPTFPAIANILAITSTGFDFDLTSSPNSTPTPNPEANNPSGVVPVEETGNINTTLDTQIPQSQAPLQLYIVANQRAYVQIVADNKVIFNGRVTTGNAYPFSGTRRLELRTGNAAALKVFFNQTDLGTLGGVGQVVTLVFTVDGIQTPTPSASLTPTPTQQFTLTTQPTPTVATPTVTPFIP